MMTVHYPANFSQAATISLLGHVSPLTMPETFQLQADRPSCRRLFTQQGRINLLHELSDNATECARTNSGQLGVAFCGMSLALSGQGTGPWPQFRSKSWHSNRLHQT